MLNHAYDLLCADNTGRNLFVIVYALVFLLM
jgi:hypothetical protein